MSFFTSYFSSNMNKKINFYILSIFFSLNLIYIEGGFTNSTCQFPLHQILHKGMIFLESIQGEIFNTTDDGTYKYSFGICVNPENKPGDYSSVIQYSIKDGKKYVIGRFNNTDIKIGNNWAFLKYGSGDPYRSHCDNTYKNSIIMIICNPDLEKGSLKLIEENTNKTSECYYLFELQHAKACNTNQILSTSSLGGGSIAVIIMVFVIVIYLIGGMVIKKLFYNQDGIELIPNIGFWRRCGNCFANCVDYVCRPNTDNYKYQRYNLSSNNNNNLTINDLDPGDDDDEILVLP